MVSVPPSTCVPCRCWMTWFAGTTVNYRRTARARRPISACPAEQGCQTEGGQSIWQIFRYHPIRLHFIATTMGVRFFSSVPLVLPSFFSFTSRSTPSMSLDQIIPDEFVSDWKFTPNAIKRVHDWVRCVWKHWTRPDFPRHATFNRVFSDTRFSCQNCLSSVRGSNTSTVRTQT